MRNIILSLAAIFIMASCGKPEQTMVNLGKLLNTEQNDTEKFGSTAKVAQNDSLFNVAALLEAAGESRIVRQASCLEILKKFDETFEAKHESATEYPDENYVVTLQRHFDSKINGYDTMIATADNERAKDAKIFLQWLKTSDGKLNNYLTTAVNAVATHDDSMVGDKWLVCPVCGDIYRDGDLFDKCDLCDTEEDKFMVIAAKNTPSL